MTYIVGGVFKKDINIRLEKRKHNLHKWSKGFINFWFEVSCNYYKENDFLIIGDIFKKDSYAKVTKNELIDCKNNLHDWLCNECWGNYICITANEDNCLHISKDFSNSFLIFYKSLKDGSVAIVSQIEYFQNLIEEDRNDFNFAYLFNYLLYNDLSTIDTAFSDIYELSPGNLLKIQKNENFVQENLFINNYYKTIKNNVTVNRDFSEILYDVLKSRLKNYDSYFLDFSGGLDSSSILLTLRHIFQDTKKIQAINFFHPQISSSNELTYARKIAKEANVSLIEFDLTSSLPLTLTNSLLIKPNRPSIHLINQKLETDLFKLTKEYSNSKIISGQGGDNIFLRPLLLESMADIFLDCGFKESFQYINNVSSFSRTPILHNINVTLKNLLRYYFRMGYEDQKPTSFSQVKQNSWIKSEVLLSKKLRPFLFSLEIKELQPGKFFQLLSIYKGLAAIAEQIRDFNNPIFFPFYSLPVIEYAVSHPSYRHFSKGYDRYLVRKSIFEKFHIKNLWRKSKGSTYGVNIMGLIKNRELVFDLCLNGEFAKNSFIDKKLLQTKINKIFLGERDLAFVYNLIIIELFLYHWRK